MTKTKPPRSKSPTRSPTPKTTIAKVHEGADPANAYAHKNSNGKEYVLCEMDGPRKGVLRFFLPVQNAMPTGAKRIAVPDGFDVVEADKSHMPMLKRSTAAH